MKVVVITPPEPIANSEEIPGVGAGDSVVEALIAAATGEFDGPTGWLGRCFGEQTLRLTAANWCEVPECLPYPPFIEVVAVRYIDADGGEQDLDEAAWSQTADGIAFDRSFDFPSISCRPDAVQVEYVAGYNGIDVSSGGTGSVPAQAKVAVIMSVSQMRAIATPDAFRKVDFVEGVGRTEYSVDGQVSKVLTDAADRLLAGLRVYR